MVFTGSGNAKANPGGRPENKVNFNRSVIRLPLLWLMVALTAGSLGAKQTEPEMSLVVADEMINIFVGPGTDYGIIDAVQPGRTLVSCGRHEDWLQICLDDGRKGFVFSRWVRPVKEDSEPTVDELLNNVDQQQKQLQVEQETDEPVRELVTPEDGDGEEKQNAQPEQAPTQELTVEETRTRQIRIELYRLGRIALYNADPKLRLEAADALGQYGREGVPVLLNVLQGGDRHTRTLAARHLGRIGGRHAVDGLIKTVANQFSATGLKQAAVKGLARQKARQAIDLLRSQLKSDPDPEYRKTLEEAIAALSE